MTAYISFCGPEGAFILSDGAMYDSTTLSLVSVVSKVSVSQCGGIAAVGTGNWKMGYYFIDGIIDRAAFVDRSTAIESLQDWVNELRDDPKHLALEAAGAGCDLDVMLLVASFVPGVGGVQRAITNFPMKDAGQVVAPAYTVKDLGPVTGCYSVSREEFDAAGIPLIQHLGQLRPWLLTHGGDIMEIVRRKGRGVGGFAELTEITAEGVRKTILRRWPEDEIGKPISQDPITPLVAAAGHKLNRRERRKMRAIA